MTNVKTYKVTDDAVLFVAGQRVPNDRIIRMTEAAARYDVMAGVLEQIEEPKPEDAKGRKPQPASAPVEA